MLCETPFARSHLEMDVHSELTGGPLPTTLFARPAVVEVVGAAHRTHATIHSDFPWGLDDRLGERELKSVIRMRTTALSHKRRVLGSSARKDQHFGNASRGLDSSQCRIWRCLHGF